MIPAVRPHQAQEVREFVPLHYPLEIREVFSQCAIDIDTLPRLDLQGRIGETEYIDFLNPDDLTESAMQFRDRLGRIGVALKFKDNLNRVGVLAVFQRDADDSTIWECGSRSSNNTISEITFGWNSSIANNQACLDKLSEAIRKNSKIHKLTEIGKRLVTWISLFAVGILFTMTYNHSIQQITTQTHVFTVAAITAALSTGLYNQFLSK